MTEYLLALWFLEYDDAACAEVLRQARYGAPHPAACERCGCPGFKRRADRPRVDRCASASCRHEHSVTAGTPLHRYKGPLNRVLAALVLLGRPGSVSTRALAGLFGIHWKNAAALVHKLRVGLAARAPVLAVERCRLETLAIHVRRPPGTRPADWRSARVLRSPCRVAALVDAQSGAFVADVARADLPVAVKHLVEAHLPGVEEVPWKHLQPCPALGRVGMVLRLTHQLVSERWLRLYVRALGWVPPDRSLPQCAHALAAVLAAPPRTWAQLRPPRVQEPRRAQPP